MLTSVLCVQEETGQTIGLSHILPLKTSNNLKEIIGKEHSYCKGDSTVQDRESTSESVHKESAPESLASSQTEVPELNSHPFSMDMLQNECENVKRKLFLNEEEAAEVEKTLEASQQTLFGMTVGTKKSHHQSVTDVLYLRIPHPQKKQYKRF